LALGIAMNCIWLENRLVFEQAIQYVNGFPNATGDEMTEQSDIGVRDMMVGDTTIATVANMTFTQKVVFIQFVMGTICNMGINNIRA
jgi:hypothetical protein